MDRSVKPARTRVVVILGAVVAIGPLSIDTYLPAFPEIGRALGAGASAVQLTLTAGVAGLALGQLVAGPLSDRFGRRRPLVGGLAIYAVASLLCAFAPSVEALIALRFVQGLAGAAGIVIGRAVVRDLRTGPAAVRLFSSLMMVTGLAPILAPILGGQLLAIAPWEGIFVVLAGLGALLALAAVAGLPETLPPERRTEGGLAQALRTMARLLADRAFVGFALAQGLAFGAVFAYVAATPFVLQEIYGLSPQLFSLQFALNGVGLVLASPLNARLVGRFGPKVLLRVGLHAIAAASLALLGVALAGLGVWAVLAPMFVVISSLAFVMPNATALALAEHGRVAGTASALIGALQFLIGAVAAPLVGLAGTATAVPMGLVMTVFGLAAVAVAHAPARGPVVA
jgi:DHA1 family bicyclomycin/chloramphenicol resistance-like MFS transporter